LVYWTITVDGQTQVKPEAVRLGPAVKMALASGLLAYGMGDFEDRWAGPGFKSSEKPGSQAEASPQQAPT